MRAIVKTKKTELKQVKSYELALKQLNNNDTLQLLNENKLYNLFINNVIDRQLYKALSYIYTHNLNSLDYDTQYKITNKMRYNGVINNFKLWYSKSSYKLSYNLLKKIIKYIKNKATIKATNNLNEYNQRQIKKYKTNNIVKLIK